MQPVRRQTLIGQVTDQLRSEIVAGAWPVGSRIPTEPELCELTGTARNTVREAVQALVHAGMLARRQGSGTYVLSSSDSALNGVFAGAREADLLELRETLDVTAAGLAAQRRTDADIVELERLLDLRDSLWADGDLTDVARARAVEVDIDLHRAIVAASHNALYLDFYDHLVPLLADHIATRPVGAATSHRAEHTELVRAVVTGDVTAARSAAKRLLSEVRQRR
ncbi:FadR/GntR family transcriptional regulator [Tsukamurella soli]|uniref:FadR/GntR family transcriptional regulator n=1 Tax=Tsukamurella soli TaxID=644556 RepID=UPI0031EF34DB